MMKKERNFIRTGRLPGVLPGAAICAALLLVSGCGDENNGAETPGSDGRVALQASGGIQTRATDAAWQTGDAIGIYMLEAGTTTLSESADNRKYATADGDGKFSAGAAGQTIYFPVDGSTVDFRAYHPYRGTLSDGVFALDVSSQTDLPAIDLMSAKVESTPEAPLDKNHPAVAFTFRHLLTKLELNISAGNGISADDLQGLKVEITKQRTAGSYAPHNELLGVASEPVKTITMNTAADGTLAQAILLPTTPADGINPVIAGRELVFTLKATGEVFRYPLPDDKGFLAGDKNIYNITINRTSLTVTATIENWNPGNGSGEQGSAE